MRGRKEGGREGGGREEGGRGEGGGEGWEGGGGGREEGKKGKKQEVEVGGDCQCGEFIFWERGERERERER